MSSKIIQCKCGHKMKSKHTPYARFDENLKYIGPSKTEIIYVDKCPKCVLLENNLAKNGEN